MWLVMCRIHNVTVHVVVIVKALITCADDLGRVPIEVGVAARGLEQGSLGTRSLDDMLSDHGNTSTMGKKQRTTSISGKPFKWRVGQG